MRDQYGCLAALRSPAHITIIPPDWFDEEKEAALKQAIDQFSEQEPPVEIQISNFAAFAPRVIYADILPNEQLRSLQARFQQMIIDKKLFPVKSGGHPFHPHITIATRDLHKKAFHEAWEAFKEKKYSASWIAKELSLLKHNGKNWEVV